MQASLISHISYPSQKSTTVSGTPLLYIQVEQAIFGLNSDDEYSVQATNSKEDIKKLLSVGFEYVCQKDDLLYFRKRK